MKTLTIFTSLESHKKSLNQKENQAAKSFF